jgi:hypothetical protein
MSVLALVVRKATVVDFDGLPMTRRRPEEHGHKPQTILTSRMAALRNVLVRPAYVAPAGIEVVDSAVLVNVCGARSC